MKITIFSALLMVGQLVSGQTTFHGDIARTGVCGSPGPTQLNALKWKFKTDGPIFSSPAIANGVVFVGSADNALYAIDEKSGQLKWKFGTSGPVNSSPAVADGAVFVGSRDGVFYSVDAESGKENWRFATQFERHFQANGLHGYSPRQQMISDAWDVLGSSPAAFNGRVYFGSSDGNVYSLDAKTGLIRWKFATKDIVHASPAIANNTVYIGSWDGSLYALDAETGAEKWRFNGGVDPVNSNHIGFQSSPAVVDGMVYVGCRDAHVYAIDAATGQKRWEYSTKTSWVSASPAVHDGIVFINSNRLYELEAKTGRLILTFDQPPVWGISSPIIAGDQVYIGGFNGRLYALDPKSGKLSWEFKTDASASDPLKVLKPDGSWDKPNFVPTFHDFEDDYVDMYRRFSVGSIMSTPVVDNGELYFGSTDGNLYALR